MQSGWKPGDDWRFAIGDHVRKVKGSSWRTWASTRISICLKKNQSALSQPPNFGSPRPGAEGFVLVMYRP